MIEEKLRNDVDAIKKNYENKIELLNQAMEVLESQHAKQLEIRNEEYLEVKKVLD